VVEPSPVAATACAGATHAALMGSMQWCGAASCTRLPKAPPSSTRPACAESPLVPVGAGAKHAAPDDGAPRPPDPLTAEAACAQDALVPGLTKASVQRGLEERFGVDSGEELNGRSMAGWYLQQVPTGLPPFHDRQMEGLGGTRLGI
jgi:hypothetical protein